MLSREAGQCWRYVTVVHSLRFSIIVEFSRDSPTSLVILLNDLVIPFRDDT